MPTLLMAGGHQLLAWAVGLTFTTVLLDVGPGFTRDHPPVGRRLAGAVGGLLAVLGLSCVLGSGAYWGGLLIIAPYTLFAGWYAITWLRGERYDRRRSLGLQTAILGGISLLVLLLADGPNQWHSGIVMGAYAASAALLGGLSIRLLDALTAEREEREESVATQATLIGLGLTCLAAVDMLGGLGFRLPTTVWLWLGLSLGLPAALVLVAPQLRATRSCVTCRMLALVSGLAGQAAIHYLLSSSAGLVPPAIL